MVLESAGHSVRIVEQPSKGLGGAADGTFDVVLLDLVMPGTSGEAVLESLRRARGTANASVIVM